MTVLNFFGIKGGVGTTTAAALMALEPGGPIVAYDVDDVRATLGMSPAPLDDSDLLTDKTVPDQQGVYRITDDMDAGQIMFNARRIARLTDNNFAVVDWGRRQPPRDGTLTMCCFDNSYIAIRRVVREVPLGWGNLFGFCLVDPGRPLAEVDVRHAVGPSFTEIVFTHRDPSIARSCDAGLLSSRPSPRQSTVVHHLLMSLEDTTP